MTRRDPGPGAGLPAQGRGWQLHRREGEIRCSTRPAGLSGGDDAGDEQTKATGDQGLSRLAAVLTWGQRSKTSRPRRSYRATTSTITRASWRSSRRTARSWPSILPAGSPGHRSDSMGTIGKRRPLLERIEKTDKLIDGCTALRSHGRGNRDSGRQQWQIVHLLLFIDLIMMA